jgi:hypothetical protein
MAFYDDTAPFFADFAAGSVTVDGVAVSAIFDNEYAAADAGLGIASTRPALTIATTSVPASPVGKAAVVNGTTYTIAEHQPDGTGVSVLLLERA